MNITDRKSEIRKQLLSRRSELSNEEYEYFSGQIINKLKADPDFEESKVIHCYVSMNERNEVDTHPLIREMLEAGDKTVAVPVMHSSGSLRHILLKSFEDLKPNSWGVPEPEVGKEISSDDLELVIVPMVGGDEECNRMGYGKGYYDRFLKYIDCTTIGLSFERCILPGLPVESSDVPLSRIITEKRVIR